MLHSGDRLKGKKLRSNQRSCCPLCPNSTECVQGKRPATRATLAGCPACFDMPFPVNFQTFFNFAFGINSSGDRAEFEGVFQRHFRGISAFRRVRGDAQAAGRPHETGRKEQPPCTTSRIAAPIVLAIDSLKPMTALRAANAARLGPLMVSCFGCRRVVVGAGQATSPVLRAR